MKHFFSSCKNLRYVIYGLLAVVFLQSVFMIYAFSTRNNKVYEVNLVQIKDQKDSMDYAEVKTILPSLIV